MIDLIHNGRRYPAESVSHERADRTERVRLVRAGNAGTPTSCVGGTLLRLRRRADLGLSVLAILILFAQTAVAATPTFTDISSGSGLNSNTLNSMVFADFNYDGYLDMAKGNTSSSGVRTICINDGDNTFTCSTTAITSGWRGVGWGDFDGDGDLDLIGRMASNSNSPATITNDGASNGLSWTETNRFPNGNNDESTMFVDIDGDGDLDIWDAGGTHLWYRNDSGTTFTQLDGMPGVADDDLPNSEGCTAADFTNDGYIDFLRNDSDTGQNSSTQAWSNDGDYTYTNHENVDTDFGLPESVGDHENMEWAWGDYDNDGDIDVFISGTNGVGLYRNNGSGVFTDVSSSAAVTITATTDGADWGDMDNDGDLDLIVAKGASSILYSNDGDGTFTDVTATAGITSLGNVAGWIDIDNDGDLDLMDGEGGLWRNDLNDSNYLRVIVVGAGFGDAPVSPIGAQITVFDAGTSTIVGYREVMAGYNNFQPPPIQHFGVTPSSSYDIQVLFPSSQKTVTKTSIQPNQQSFSMGSTTLSNMIRIAESLDVKGGLDGFWKLNDASGTNATDSSGNGNDATVTNASWGDGIFGGALDFDGTGDYLDIPTSIAGSDVGSVSLWVRTGTNFTDLAHLYYGSDVATGDGSGGENELHVNFTSSETIQFFIEGTPDVSITSANTYANGAWHHVAATWDVNANAILYVDGISVGSAAHNADNFVFSSTHRVGRPATNTRLFTGKIDDIRLFSRVINPAEVRTLAKQSGLLAHWKLDDAAGATAIDSVAGNDGVVTGATWADGRLCGALDFDGTSDQVEDADGESYINGLTALTLSLWIKSDLTGTDRGFFIAKAPADNDEALSIRYDAAGINGGGTNGIKAGVTVSGTDQTIESSSSVQTTSWQHLAVTWSTGNQLALYIDGSLDSPLANDAAQSGSISAADTVLIGIGGKDTGTSSWDGRIDDVRIYNRVLTLAEIQALAATYTLIDLGSLNGQRGLGVSINNPEQVAGFDQASADGAESAWRSQYCLMTALGTLGSGADSAALDINDSGTVCGWSHETDGDRKAFTWTSGGGLVDLGTLAGTTDSEAAGINASSEVCGTSLNFGATPADWEAFLYLPVAAYSLSAGMNSLGTLGGAFSVAMDLNDSGQVVGGASTAIDYHEPFIWLPSAAYSLSAGMNTLGTLGGNNAALIHRAQGINSNGETVGRSYTAGGAGHGFIWLPSAAYGQSAGMTDLGVLTGGDESWTFDINASGQVVGTSNVTGGAFHAFLWDNGTLSDLNNLTDTNSTWTLTRATGINDDGEIVGFGTDGDGNVKAFVLIQTCSTGQATVASLAGIVIGELKTEASVQGVIDEVVLDDTGAPLAELRVVNADSAAEFDISVRTQNLVPASAASARPLPTTGLADASVVDRTLEIKTTTPGSYKATVGMIVSNDELGALGVLPEDLTLHVFDSLLARWVPAGENIGESAPTDVVGDSGFVPNVDDTVTFWAVRDTLSLFAVGAPAQAFEPVSDPPAEVTVPAVCGLGIVQAGLMSFAGLMLVSTRRRRLFKPNTWV